jgi:hypothetical protein
MNYFSVIKSKIRSSSLYVKVRRYGIINTIRRLYYKRMMRRIDGISIVSQSTLQPCEVHILTSAWDWDLALWALHSFYHWTSVDWPLVVHDGGGLGPREWAIFRSHFPNARFLPASQADVLVNKWLAERDLSSTIHARANYNLMRKVIDTAITCQARRYILLDSDVLFFKKPDHLLRIAQENNPQIHLLRDYQNSYSINSDVSKFELGLSLPDTINTGLAVIPKSAIDFEFMETIFDKSVIPLDQDGFAEQTVLALLASQAGFEYLPEVYKVVTCPSSNRDEILRHYVGPVKRLFFDEGVPMFIEWKHD